MSFQSEVATYAGRIREFDGRDWAVYVSWVGLMLGLVGSTGGFLLFGHNHGVEFSPEAWLVPVGAAIFAASIAFDTIGHRTIYAQALKGGEQLVHHITIFCGIGSCVLLTLAFSFKVAAVPAMVLTVLSFVYSLVDEAFHWRRYVTEKSDPVEMWSHVGIMVGHGTMMVAWWTFYYQGYPGVAETVALLSGG